MGGIAIVAEGAVLQENGENISLGLRSAISEVAGCLQYSSTQVAELSFSSSERGPR